MVMLLVYILSVVLAAVVGFRLGRSGDTDKSIGAGSGAAGRAVDDSKRTLTDAIATTEDINRAVDESIRSNEEARDIIAHLQDIVHRHTGGTGGGSGV